MSSDVLPILPPDQVAMARLPIERASTLPAAAYTSPAIYDREVERIFGREWLCAGRVEQVREPGDYFTLDLMGHKLVVVRGLEGEVRTLSRICRHRFAELVRGRGRTRSLQCPYHAWTYRLDGSLVGAPMMEQVEFDRSRCRLPSFRTEVWEGFVFVNLDPEAAPLAPRLSPLAELLAPYAIRDMVAGEPAIYDSAFNWKVLVENFMESYHHIATHRDTLEPVFPAKESSVLESEGPYSVLRMPSTAGAPESALPSIEGLEGWRADSLLAVAVYPSHLFALTAQSMSWYQLLPADLGRFELRIYTCVPKATAADPALDGARHGMHDITKVVHAQDIGACEAVWQGMNTGMPPQGRLHTLEKAIWQQNQWWLQRIVD